jgi:hypothetical protein
MQVCGPSDIARVLRDSEAVKKSARPHSHPRNVPGRHLRLRIPIMSAWVGKADAGCNRAGAFGALAPRLERALSFPYRDAYPVTSPRLIPFIVSPLSHSPG